MYILLDLVYEHEDGGIPSSIRLILIRKTLTSKLILKFTSSKQLNI